MKKKLNNHDSNCGENIRKIRKSRGLTQIELARLAGISRRMIGHYETSVKRPSVDTIKRIAAALQVTDDEIFGEKNFIDEHADYDVSFKILKKTRLIEKFPVRDQKKVFKLINELAEKNGLKG